MSDAFDRIKARSAARTAAAAAAPPGMAPVAPEPAPDPDAAVDADVSMRLGDLEQTVMELRDSVDSIQQSMVEDVLADIDEEVPVSAALPDRAPGDEAPPVPSVEERLAALEARLEPADA